MPASRNPLPVSSQPPEVLLPIYTTVFNKYVHSFLLVFLVQFFRTTFPTPSFLLPLPLPLRLLPLPLPLPLRLLPLRLRLLPLCLC